MVPSLHRRYSASSLLRTSPSPCRLSVHFLASKLLNLPSFRDFSSGSIRVSPVPYVSCAIMSSLLLRRCGVLRRSRFNTPCCLRPCVTGSTLRILAFRSYLCVHFRYDLMARECSLASLSDGLRRLRYLHRRHLSYRVTTLSRVGLVSH